MTKKHKQVCTFLSYIEKVLILVSAITVCISISAFASLISTLIGIASSAKRFKISAITAAIKKYKSIIKKKIKRQDSRWQNLN